MAADKKTRPMIEVTDEARYRLKAVAALRGITMRELIEQTARQLGDEAGVKLPASMTGEAERGKE